VTYHDPMSSSSLRPIVLRILVLGALVVLVTSAFVIGQEPRGSATMLTIREYQPKSTLVTTQHPVPRARFPVIDVHSHHSDVPTGAQLDALVGEMDALNLRVLVNLSGGTGARLKSGVETIKATRHRDRMVFFANLDFRDLNEPGYGARAAARLEADVKAGAVGLKIFKNFGLHLQRANGVRVPTDDREFDPVWQTCARLQIPVLIHTGEPKAFFDPVDRHNERWLELQLRPQNRLSPDRFPTFDALMAERDRLFARHPKTTFIVAHFGWYANDLGRLGAMLDRLPNTVVETGAILHELGRQPRAAAAFFAKYQDRILFGKDRYEASEFPYFFRVFETEDEYFDYYRDYHAFWKLYGLGLPDAVLRKLYSQNAQRIVPGLPRVGA
jgi:predicted TIM-barrel fold metal-dependent hydrolase